MATSGTRTFTLYVNEIIEEAYSRIGGETITGKESSSARRSLNLLFKEWSNRSIQLWSVGESTQTLTSGTANYTLNSFTIDVEEAVISVTLFCHCRISCGWICD